jgi:uncharacterized protein (DUF2235 family)
MTGGSMAKATKTDAQTEATTPPKPAEMVGSAGPAGANEPGRNLLIFSDGTGQRGGLVFDERRSNVYKIYRATRCGPDTEIDPARQLAHYDPGLGTLPGGIDSIVGLGRSLYNLASQGTGLGILGNIEDCYAAIIKYWRPGDRIFLFGFSRGAYTVRCLAGVLSLCGIPTQVDGQPLVRTDANIKRVARAAVRDVFDYANARHPSEAKPREIQLLAQRDLLAEKFRLKYGSDDHGKANEVPYFIGAFDTVASLSNPVALAGLSVVGVILLALLGLAASLIFGNLIGWISIFAAAGVGAAMGWLLASRVKWAFGLAGHPFWTTLHWKSPRPKLYDKTLDRRVSYARHAISIDERRASFPRVKWGQAGEWRGGKPVWFEQKWFAGNHSDIGGSYPENESRLSDIALEWMVDAARDVGMLVDPALLRTFPDPLGEQHDETASGIFKLAKKCPRDPIANAPLHPSVLERFRSAGVLQSGHVKAYRPESLRHHDEVKHFYG